jgi:transitional endoplasmic reticulum ATPase
MTLPVDALLAALEASPDNAALRAIVAQACVDADDVEPLRRALARFGGDLFADDGVRARAIERLRAADAHALADTLADAPEALLAHARLALRDGRRDEARDAYERAIARNPALEDRALAAELEGRVVSLASARRPVASVSNDDTGDADVVRLVQPQVARQTFADVGGLDAVKEQIRRRIITPFLKPSLFERFKRRAGGGILMYGPPGCGKTLLARATAGECGARFFNVAINDVLDMYIGESERKLHALFEQARSAAPAVLFFDEVEALGGKRQHAREATSAKLVSQFLTELDGFAQANQGVLILGATNVPWAVDPAFRRPGRFDRVLFVPPPDDAARRAILALQLEGRPNDGRIDVTELARLTAGFSGADLRHLIESGIDEAIESSITSGRETPLTMQHLRDALKDTRATTLEWLTTARNHARYANQGGQYDDVLAFLDRHGERR